jgi:hypothetical protein
MAKRGPKLIQPDWKLIEALCQSQCTQDEIAAHLDVSLSSLERVCRRDKGMKFDAFFKQKRKRGFVSLRHKQYQIAIGGNVTMLIWLGKQWLGQTDKQVVTTKDATPKESPVDIEKFKEQLKQMKAVSEVQIVTLVKE